MNILIMTDLEGVAGLVSFEDQTGPAGRYYEAAKKLLTAEVNAAIEGLLQEGVDEILVLDGHGAGAICFEELHPAAKLFHGRPWAPWPRLIEVFKGYDACMMVGQHAMAGVATGSLNHTQNSQAVDYYQLNGHKIGELGQFALFCGALGLPMIFLSGDQDACLEAQALIPGIVTAAVKQGLSRGSAISLSAPEARRRIRLGAEQAIRQHLQQPLPPLVWPGPYALEIRYFSSRDADQRAAHPLAQRLDSQTVRFTSASVLEIIYL